MHCKERLNKLSYRIWYTGFSPKKWREQIGYNMWYNSLPTSKKEYLKTLPSWHLKHHYEWSKTPIWYDADIYKAIAFGLFLGFVIGLVVGYDWASEPVRTSIRYLRG